MRSIIIGASVLFLGVFALVVVVLFIKNRRTSRELEKLVEDRTRELTLQSAKLQAIFDSIPDIVFCKDLDLRYTQCNKISEKYTGIKEADVVGKNDIETGVFPADIAKQIMEIDHAVLSKGRQSTVEETMPYSDGIMRTLETIRSPLVQNGIITGLIVVARDITRRKEMEAAALAASRSKSVFLANMSHEIRTPLNAILGISENKLQEETLSPEINEAFARIFNSGGLLLGIINDILDLSKIEAGKLELTESEYDVASLINDTVFLNMIKYENKPIEFIINVDENVPQKLFGDEIRIKQVLNNILSNAFKYTDSGEVEFSLALENPPEGSGDGTERPGTERPGTVTIVFRVRDTGQGMTQEQLAKLGSEYSRFNLQTPDGTGLGMSITKNLIQMMNGEILAESEPGKGSLFTVHLPQGTAGAPALGKETAEKLRQFRSNNETQTKKLKVQRSSISSGKVLIVDDMEMNLVVVKEMLVPYGLQIDTAISGFEAVEKVKNSAYSLVFMDHMMPKMDGIEATQEIRKLGENYEKLPIIALTANAVSGMKEMFLENGFNGFISKPVSLRELDKVLTEWMPPDKTPGREKNES